MGGRNLPLPVFIPWRTRYESVNYGLSNYSDRNSHKVQTKLYKIPTFGVNRPNSKQDTAIWKCQNLTKKCMAIRTLSEHSVRMAIHFSVILMFLKMISSPYCAVSEPNVYKYWKRLTRWNPNRCCSLRITYLIFETFQILFPTASLIFTAVKVFIIQVIYQEE